MDAQAPNFASFPTTRYQGSKRKITPWLYEVFNSIDFNSALDVFGGSGTVSYLLKKMNKSVTYNDVLKFNYYIGKSIIENNNAQLSIKDITTILNTSDKLNSSDFICNTFSNRYYLDDENLWLDKVISNIEFWSQEANIDNHYKRYIAYNSLFQSSLVKRPYNLFHRNNLSLRTADVKRSFGNKTTWDTPFDVHFVKFANEINKSIFSSNSECNAINESVMDIDTSPQYDLVYLDPPYLNKSRHNESSDYQKYYHFLEGIANYNQWESNIDYSSNILKFNKNKNIFIKSNIMHIYNEIFDKFSSSTIVLSYKENGTPSIDELTSWLKRFKKNVTIEHKPYKYALQKKSSQFPNSEVIIIAK